MDNSNSEKKKSERFVRWQGYTIQQLSFTVNLFVGFAVASLAYIISLKVNHPELEFNHVVPIVSWSFSALFGVIATLSRLYDFRYTASRIRHGDDNKDLTEDLGDLTWYMLWLQILAYALGAFCFILGILTT